MQEITITSVSHYVECIGNVGRGERALFRGQRRDLPLVPKLARLRTYLPLLQVEQAMLDEFKRRSIPFLEEKLETNWDWLALMQHYGLATRLLDWSGNPLAALWFSVYKPPANNQNAVVWMLKPHTGNYCTSSNCEDPFQLTSTRLFIPKNIVKRISSQGGYFTVHHLTSEEETFLPLENNPTYTPHLAKFMIPPDLFGQIRFQLDRLGINSAILFPDLEGLCLHIEWLYSCLEDEKSANAIKKTFRLEGKYD